MYGSLWYGCMSVLVMLCRTGMRVVSCAKYVVCVVGVCMLRSIRVSVFAGGVACDSSSGVGFWTSYLVDIVSDPKCGV